MTAAHDERPGAGARGVAQPRRSLLRELLPHSPARAVRDERSLRSPHSPGRAATTSGLWLPAQTRGLFEQRQICSVFPLPDVLFLSWCQGGGWAQSPSSTPPIHARSRGERAYDRPAALVPRRRHRSHCASAARRSRPVGCPPFPCPAPGDRPSPMPRSHSSRSPSPRRCQPAGRAGPWSDAPESRQC